MGPLEFVTIGGLVILVYGLWTTVTDTMKDFSDRSDDHE